MPSYPRGTKCLSLTVIGDMVATNYIARATDHEQARSLSVICWTKVCNTFSVGLKRYVVEYS